MSSFVPVYLHRKGNPSYLLRRFLTSFFRSNEGNGLRLTVLLKGFSEEVPSELNSLNDEKRSAIHFVHVSDEGMDLTAYRTLCRISSESHFLFFNSSSCLLSPDWWKIYANTLKACNGKGLIGASASYGAHAHLGSTMPNPHIRSNAFLISRQDYLAAAKGDLLTKRECHSLESGPNSLTQYFLKQNLPVILVDRNGNRFDIDTWPITATFSLQDQQDLLVSDNRSEKYHSAFATRRNKHATESWGAAAIVSPVSSIRTMKRLLWDRWSAGGHAIPLVRTVIERELSK